MEKLLAKYEKKRKTQKPKKLRFCYSFCLLLVHELEVKMGSTSPPDKLYMKSFQILCRIRISMLARSNSMEQGVSDVTMTPGEKKRCENLSDQDSTFW